jgi:hypothetical protein
MTRSGNATNLPRQAILKYAGIPSYSNAVEWTHDLTPPVTWTPLLTSQANSVGLIFFTNTPSGTSDFYRTRHVSGP